MFLEDLKNVLWLAVLKHGDQRYGAHPYKKHLLDAISVAVEFGVTDEAVLLALALHDGLEDTDMTREDIELTLPQRGSIVADIVSCVTNEPGANRKERALRTYPKIAASRQARITKLCDRIANVRSCWSTAENPLTREKSLLGMYKAEYPQFRKALRPEVPHGSEVRLWAELDRLMAWSP